MPDKIACKEIESEVVIIGYGGAGAAAAITAHDLGAEVLILEKLPTGGGNTALGPSSFNTPPRDKVSQAVALLEKLSFGNTPNEVIQAYVEEAINNKEWIEKLGGTTQVTHLRQTWPWHGPPAWPNIPGTEAITNSYVTDRDIGNLNPWSTETRVEVQSGRPLWKLLSSNVESRGIKVMVSTPAKELVTNKKGEVVGLIAEHQGKMLSIKARRAVVLTSGGFGSSEVMRSQYLPFSKFYVEGSPGSTGDGIIMAQKVGAVLWHMTVIQSSFGLHRDEYQYPFGIQYYTPRFIWVNQFGRRFTTETGWEAHMMHWTLMRNDPMVPGYPQLPVFVIFDKEGVKERLSRQNLNNYEWSEDNSAEIAKGWIKKGSSLRELARQLLIDEESLENTVNRYNENCRLGIDPEHGRLKDRLAPLDSPPYYGLELWPKMTGTMGGPRRDPKARVLNLEGRPIPRLYSAGELGSFQGFLYCGGASMGEPLAVGRIAGRNAAAEEPLSTRRY
jgi:succinate dehydrogenase/fumarate reductase flavoprotein subunit